MTDKKKKKLCVLSVLTVAIATKSNRTHGLWHQQANWYEETPQILCHPVYQELELESNIKALKRMVKVETAKL